MNGLKISGRWRAAALSVMVMLPLPWVTSAETLKIVPWGDSITFGGSGDLIGGYRFILADKLAVDPRGFDFVLTGHRCPESSHPFPSRNPEKCGSHSKDCCHAGDPMAKVDDIAGSFNTWAEQSPHIAMLMGGTNDMESRERMERALKDMESLIQMVYERLPRLILMVATITRNSDATSEALVKEYNNALAALVQKHIDAGRPMRLVNMHDALLASDFADNVHPNKSGYGKMAQVWFDALVPVLTQSPTTLFHGDGTQPVQSYRWYHHSRIGFDATGAFAPSFRFGDGSYSPNGRSN